MHQEILLLLQRMQRCYIFDAFTSMYRETLMMGPSRTRTPVQPDHFMVYILMVPS